MNKKVASTLDPEFVAEIQATIKAYDANQENADDNKWVIGRKTNEMWEEHKNLTFDGFTTEKVYETKDEFYAAVSFVANLVTKKKRLSASGETLRKWCELQLRYAGFPEAELLLQESSFKTMQFAAKLYKDEKVKSPLEAVARAIEENWTAWEMREHYDPRAKLSAYDAVRGWLASMISGNIWKFIKDTNKRNEIVGHAKEIQRIIEAEILAEGKAL